MRTRIMVVGLAVLAGCGGASKGEDGGLAGDGGATGGRCFALGAACTGADTCCNSLHCVGGRCAYRAGDTCLGDKYDNDEYPGDPDPIACCNTIGGKANTGTVATRCYANRLGQGGCATDADCVLGDVCGVAGCETVCSVGGYPFAVPCCDGQLGSGFGSLCGYPAGHAANDNSLCYSGALEYSATAASCK